MPAGDGTAAAGAAPGLVGVTAEGVAPVAGVCFGGAPAAGLASVGNAGSVGPVGAALRRAGGAPRSAACAGATAEVVARAVGIGAVGLKVVVFASDGGGTRAVGRFVGR